ncbi:hypothetical protein QR680_017644 [Steinernema hermaphroditum]|uniref:Hint domain-containing protein n=1 Tax=Steinernema hermaphroditum TaxID=289476 RepID=A0AA39HFB4_9BILA|nr:hypothetical protein QR680_017644 [Steinernema hermaphroditum]
MFPSLLLLVAGLLSVDAKILQIGDGCSRRSLPSQVVIHPTTQPELICARPKCIELEEFEIKCSEGWQKSACAKEEEWSRGVAHQLRGNRVDLMSQCCSSEGLRGVGTQRKVTLNETDSFFGGNVLKGRKVVAFDMVKSLQRVIVNGDKITHEVTVQRIPCERAFPMEKKIPVVEASPPRRPLFQVKLQKKPSRAFAAPIGQEGLPVPLQPEFDYVDDQGRRIDPATLDTGFQKASPPEQPPNLQLAAPLQNLALSQAETSLQSLPFPQQEVAAADEETVEVVEESHSEEAPQEKSYLGNMGKYFRRLIEEYGSGDSATAGPACISNPNANPTPTSYSGASSGGAHGGYSSGIYCFSGDSLIETSSGVVAMKDLRKGDSVLSIDRSMVTFSPVVMFLHRVEDVSTVFLSLTVSDGATIKLTPEHLIYRSPCHSSSFELMAAKNVAVGDCLFSKTSQLVKVVSVGKVEEVGYYAPLTATGDLFVDGFLCSCYSNSNLKFVLDGLFSMMRTIDSWSERLIFRRFFEDDFELPTGVAFLAENVKSFLLI